MTAWNTIYSEFNPIAFSLFGLSVHWYGLMYVSALLVALLIAKWLVRKDSYPLSQNLLDSFFIWVEIGVILGARIGYIIFYDPHTSYYLSHPWQIFNPFDTAGNFVGIRGMSYHGAVLGFLIASIIFAKVKKVNFWLLMDLSGLSIPLGYVFGRIGNFLNQELVGRETTNAVGILVDGILRHPSQLYEAFLEGILVFIILFIYRKYKKFDGELISLYVILYSIMRFVSEIFRQPDVQIGKVLFGLNMGQILSFLMLFLGVFLYFYLKNKTYKNHT